MPLSLPTLPTSRTTTILLLSLIPIAAPTAYLLNLKATVSRHVTSTTLIRHPRKKQQQDGSQPSASAADPPPEGGYPVTLPADVSGPSSPYVVSQERVTSRPIPLTALAQPFSPALMTAYVGATMEAYSRTPAAFAVWMVLRGDPDADRTFARAHIRSLAYADGDLVNGAYRVVYRGDGGRGPDHQRVELAICPPPSYTGPPVRGMIVVACEPATDDRGEDCVVFVNETWLWRTTEEKPSMLETVFGRWTHALMAEWLVVKGVRAVTTTGKVKDA